MKKIINNKLYNTETATLVASWHNNTLLGDFYRQEEDLYIKRTGEFFLCEAGFFKRFEDKSIGWGEEITPLTIQEAKKWAEESISADEYIKIFGEEE